MATSAEKQKGITRGKHEAKVGVTKKELFTILDRASQPVKHEAESDKKLK